MECHHWLFILIDRQSHQLYVNLKQKTSDGWILNESLKIYCPIICQELYVCSLCFPKFPDRAVTG